MKDEESEVSNIVDGKVPAVADPVLEKLKNTLFSEYFPVQKFEEGVILMSTRDIWSMLQRLYPNEILYSPADVANWLHEKGFTFLNHGELRYEWMLKPEP
ncbi:MAG: hypothetical protein V4594_16755 [Bacteroidota bacterium]